MGLRNCPGRAEHLARDATDVGLYRAYADAEWVRLTQGYAQRQGSFVSVDAVMAALRWIEPERDVGLVRELARRRIERGELVDCV